MTTSGQKGRNARATRALGAAGGIALAASPVFALMALGAANDPGASTLCSARSNGVPIGGMTAMYLLMSVFHLPPWLKLRARGALLTTIEGDR